MKQILAIVILIIISTNVIYSQNEIEQVRFEYAHSIKVNAEIYITMYPDFENSEMAIVKAKIEGNEITTEISIKTFEEICRKIINIKAKDLIGLYKIGLDGATSELSFSSSGNKINYQVSNLVYSDEFTNLKDFFYVVKMMLNSVNFKINGIN